MLKRLLALSRTTLGLITISAIAVTAILLIVFNVLRSDQPTESALTFCEEYPEALVCIDPDATEISIAYDMFDTIKAHYPAVMDETFCTLYFTGKLSEYCVDDYNIIFPNGFSGISSDYYLEEVREGIYDVNTKYPSGSPAYTIRIALTDDDGVWKVSGFSFVDAPPIVALELTSVDINTYMISMIEASVNQNVDFCTTYFVEKASQDCINDPSSFVFDQTAIYNYDIVSVITNDYYYVVRNEDNTVTYQYHVDFIEQNDTIVISDISVKELE